MKSETDPKHTFTETWTDGCLRACEQVEEHCPEAIIGALPKPEALGPPGVGVVCISIRCVQKYVHVYQ